VRAPVDTVVGIAHPADDRSLVTAAQSGDRGALDALLRRHQARLWGLCRRLAGNDADGQDALQEAMIALVRGLPHFDGRAAFTTWSYRVATNAALDELRRRKRRPTPGLPDLDGPGMPATSAAAVDGAVADRLDVDAAVAALPEDFRAAVVLRDLCDLEYSEIAEILDIPPGTVRSRIARGRGQLADLLGTPRPPTTVQTPTP
jgi:RNA polymerase sigma-70 factor (ECF subfamily)